MHELHDDIILMIFEKLDNESIFNLIKVSNRFAAIYSSSPKLQRKFNLLINKENVHYLSSNNALPNVPYRTVTISRIHFITEINLLLILLKKFKNHIEFLTIDNCRFNNAIELKIILSDQSNLTALEFKSCRLNSYENTILPFMPKLKFLSITHYCCSQISKLFCNQLSIEKVAFCHSIGFNELATTLPNLNHVIMEGTNSPAYFDQNDFPIKIRKWEIYLLSGSWYSTTTRLNFLESQRGFMKELTITKLPYDYDGGEVLKFIIEKMDLEKFYFGKIPLILDGKKQELKEFTAWEVNINCAFEMFRQFPTVESFCLFLTHTGIDRRVISQIVNPRTNIFNNLKNLDVLDHSGSIKLFSWFVELYKNCRNITRLSFRTDDESINVVLQECLSSMTSLKEIYLQTCAPNSLERLKIIRNQAPNVKKLSINNEFVNEAREFFGNDVEIIGI